MGKREMAPGSSGRALFAAFVLSAIINCPAAFGQEGAPADDPAAMAEQALAARNRPLPKTLKPPVQW